MTLAHADPAGPPLDSLQVLTAVVLLTAAWLYLDGALRARAVLRPRTALYLAGLVTVAAALLSPLETWADDLLVVHAVQHVLLVLVAAPLLVLARPAPVLLRGLPPGLRATVARSVGGPGLRAGRSRLLAPVAAVAHVVVLWVGHVPPVYDAVLQSSALHVGEHVLLLATGGLLWWAVLDPAGRSHATAAPRLVAVAVSAGAGLALGVALLFAPRPWYTAHEQAWRWGLSPLDDQHAAGALMWAAGGPGYALAGALVAVRLLRGAAPSRSSGGTARGDTVDSCEVVEP